MRSADGVRFARLQRSPLLLLLPPRRLPICHKSTRRRSTRRRSTRRHSITQKPIRQSLLSLKRISQSRRIEPRQNHRGDRLSGVAQRRQNDPQLRNEGPMTDRTRTASHPINVIGHHSGVGTIVARTIARIVGRTKEVGRRTGGVTIANRSRTTGEAVRREAIGLRQGHRSRHAKEVAQVAIGQVEDGHREVGQVEIDRAEDGHREVAQAEIDRAEVDVLAVGPMAIVRREDDPAEVDGPDRAAVLGGAAVVVQRNGLAVEVRDAVRRSAASAGTSDSNAYRGQPARSYGSMRRS